MHFNKLDYKFFLHSFLWALLHLVLAGMVFYAVIDGLYGGAISRSPNVSFVDWLDEIVILGLIIALALCVNRYFASIRLAKREEAERVRKKIELEKQELREAEIEKLEHRLGRVPWKGYSQFTEQMVLSSREQGEIEYLKHLKTLPENREQLVENPPKKKHIPSGVALSKKELSKLSLIKKIVKDAGVTQKAFLNTLDIGGNQGDISLALRGVPSTEISKRLISLFLEASVTPRSCYSGVLEAIKEKVDGNEQ